MKKAIIILTLAISAIGWSSCKKKTTPAPDPVYPAGMHAKINGIAWNPQYLNKVSVAGGGHYSLEIDGPDSVTNETLSISLPDFTGKGVHTITATSADKAYYALDTNYVSVSVYATTGQIDITSLNDTAVGGTFYFTAGGKTITEGTFNVNF